MAIQLADKYEKYVDEIMTTASSVALVAGAKFKFTGAKNVMIYKIGTAPMQDYGRNTVEKDNWSHYGEVSTLEAGTEEMALEKDRSFTFEIDKLDADETAGNLEAASALNRQLREKVVPEIDIHTYGRIVEKAGIKPDASALTVDNIYEAIAAGSEALDEAEVPEDGRYILVTPKVLKLMKLNKNLAVNSDIGEDLRKKGAVATVDGAAVMKIPSKRLPKGFGFLYGHPMATCAPIKIADYKIHRDPPGLSGSLVEGRVNYDAFVLENKTNALYYHSEPVDEQKDEPVDDPKDEQEQ